MQQTNSEVSPINHQKNPLSRRMKVFIILAVILVAFLTIDLFTFAGGNIRFYSK